MPMNVVGKPLAIERIADNAAALGITPAQLSKLLEGVELKSGSGFMGFMAKQTDFKELMGSAAEELAKLLKSPRAVPQQTKAEAPAPQSLASKVEEAARLNAEKVGLAEAAKVELREKLPAFMRSEQVKTLARGIGELLNPPNPQRPIEQQAALSLLDINVPKSGTDDELKLHVLATRNGIRVVDNKYYGSHKTSSIKPETLAAYLTRAGMSLHDLQVAVHKASDELLAGKARGHDVEVNRLDQLLQRPFDTSFSLEAEAKKIETGTPHTIGLPWTDYAKEARGRAQFALDYLDTLAPGKVQPKEFVDAAEILLRSLSKAKAQAGQTAVLQLFVGDTVAIFDKVDALARQHGLTKGDMSDANVAILFYNPMSYRFLEPDGVERRSGDDAYKKMHGYYESGIGIYQR